MDKNLFSGIAKVKEYFKTDKIFIFRSCVNLIRELKSYRWGDGDVPIKRDDHCLDELRYFIASRPKTEKPEGEKTAVQRDKEKLIKKLTTRRKGRM